MDIFYRNYGITFFINKFYYANTLKAYSHSLTN
ncbi:MAG: hypothetical protein K0S24_2358 [Sphingobacterium sp.]|jgi:hypothetical protein|nr:hypothetical protein [Sphingobacterium sp.]